MPKPAGKKKYSAGQMRIARVAPPRDKITGAAFAKLRKNGKKNGKRSTPMKDSGKRMTPAMKAALKKRLGKK